MSVLFQVIHMSGFAIVIINAALLIEVLFGLEFIPFWFKSEIVGAADVTVEHVAISANNINTLFFIAPVVYVCAVSKYMHIKRSKFSSGTLLFLIMVIAVLSGRRALLLLLFFIPIVYTVQSFIVADKYDLRSVSLSFPIAFMVFMIPVAILLIADLIELIDISVYLGRFGENIDVSNARSDQFHALINGFVNNYWFGSGFGISVEIIRDADRPWLYELTYLQLLFNVGLIGISAFFLLLFIFYAKAIWRVSNFSSCKTEALALLTGFVIFSAGAASNPYYSGFDTLAFIGVIPLLAGWRAYSN
jgi:hypothetical protein